MGRRFEPGKTRLKSIKQQTLSPLPKNNSNFRAYLNFKTYSLSFIQDSVFRNQDSVFQNSFFQGLSSYPGLRFWGLGLPKLRLGNGLSGPGFGFPGLG